MSWLQSRAYKQKRMYAEREALPYKMLGVGGRGVNLTPSVVFPKTYLLESG